MEPVLRNLRIGRVLNEIKKVPNCMLLDVGCGFNHKFLSTVEPYIAQGVGIDFKVPNVSFRKIRAIQMKLNETMPFHNDSFNIATMLAVLEHLEKPKQILDEIARVLQDEGKLILTVPGKRAKPVLEFLAFKLGIVNRAEIEDHKKYYDLTDLQELADQSGKFEIVHHRYFQFGMNNFCVMKKI
ncbi:class I SAM-dependent methyltransferase [Candidatus Electronema sp. TJ]|uniref:class I SAM-dependent methyltransferase n=1 Tax=Candidatus Electronema sp. TJ TaxID=3401573 RepID=UPI003AA86C39